MVEVDAESLAGYLRERGWVAAGAELTVRELAGGVSNVVLRVDVAGEGPFVVKQCRERLRVAMDWRAPLERIWTEVAAMRLLAEVLPAGTVPAIRFEDPENYMYAMECAPDGAVTWKERLMAGEVDPERGRQVGALLGTIHAEARAHPAMAGRLADTSLFDHLRVDPYYRTVARAHPDLAPALGELIAAMPEVPDRTFVHGDFSPKNLLVSGPRLILLDFECAHAGDPAFDLGFLASHLILKTFRAARGGDLPRPAAYLGLLSGFWDEYVERTGPEVGSHRSHRAARHTAACLLARLDGKSPVEYRGELDQDAVRGLARGVLGEPCGLELPGLIERVGERLP